MTDQKSKKESADLQLMVTCSDLRLREAVCKFAEY